ncbi:hypothetical protein [Endothiovibrio diazotrophicus]
MSRLPSFPGRTRRKVVEPQVVGTVADCGALEAGRPLLLCGDLVLVDRDGSDPGPGFVQQRDRQVARGAPLAVWLRNEAVAAVAGHRRVALAVDGYLRWGMSQRSPTLLVAGFAPNHGESNIEAYAFRDGALFQCQEAMLPPRSDDRFERALADHIEAVRATLPGDGWQVVTASPLPPLAGIEHVGEAPLARIKYGPLRARRPQGRRHTLPLLLIVLGVVAYAAALGIGQWRYQAAVTQFRAQRVGAAALAVSLDRLLAMRRYLDSSGETNQGLSALGPILAATARLDGAILRSVHLAAQPTLGEAALELELALPRREASGLKQGAGILQALALGGWELTLDRHRDLTLPVRGEPRPYRIFHLEGRRP